MHRTRNVTVSIPLELYELIKDSPSYCVTEALRQLYESGWNSNEIEVNWKEKHRERVEEIQKLNENMDEIQSKIASYEEKLKLLSDKGGFD